MSPVLVLLHRRRAASSSALSSLSALLLSGRPVQIVVLSGRCAAGGPALLSPRAGLPRRRASRRRSCSRARSPSRCPWRPASTALSPAGAPVCTSSTPPTPARPPTPRAASSTPGWSLRRASRGAPHRSSASTREAGSSWARRLHFDENPEPSADWPSEPLLVAAKPRISSRFWRNGLADAPSRAAFTFADAALLDPAWRSQFALAEGSGGAGRRASSARRVAGPRRRRERPPPAVRLGGRHRGRPCIVWSCRALWRSRPAIAWPTGARSKSSPECATSMSTRRSNRRAAKRPARAAREREELAARHARELESLRETSDQRAVDRLISTLFEIAPTVRRRRACGARPAGTAKSSGAALAPLAPVTASATPRGGCRRPCGGDAGCAGERRRRRGLDRHRALYLLRRVHPQVRRVSSPTTPTSRPS